MKPHPAAILPLAITVKIAREVLAEAGFDPNVVTLVAHDGRRRHRADARAAARGEAGRFHRQHRERQLARGATRARRRCTPRRRASTRSSSTRRPTSRASCAMSPSRSSLYTGQMCTAPQNIYVPKDGIDTAEGHLSFDEVAAALAEGVQKLLADPARAVEVLGAVSERRCPKPARSGARARDRSCSTRRRSRIRSFPNATDPHAADRQARRGRSRQVPRTSGSVRSRSSSRPRRPRESLAIARDAVRRTAR